MNEAVNASTPDSPAHHLDLEKEIDRLRKDRNAVILAHYYQDPAIQDIADFVGDSLDLSRKAAETDADMIVFCGVRFMGEVAKILSPEKKVVIPDMQAGCSLEESISADDLRAFKAKHPDHLVVTYINSSVEVKAESDYVVTSASAIDIINATPADKPILFVPDRHLGRWLEKVTGREMTLWPGECIVHVEFTTEAIEGLKTKYPDAKIAVHPESPEPVVDMADHVGSTRSIIDYVVKTDAKRFIIGTETHILHQIRKQAPDKELIPLPGSNDTCQCATCPYMALNTMEKLYLALKDERPEIIIDEDLRRRALLPLQRMLDISARAQAKRAAREEAA